MNKYWLLFLCVGVAVTDPTNATDEDKGFVDVIDNIVNLGKTVTCATGQGQAGHCSVGNCPNLGNETAVRCNGNKLTKCCPTETAREVFPQQILGCGIRPKRAGNFIVGGQQAIPHSWPWAVALYRVSGVHRSFLCGGSIINSQYIITAAHCVVRSKETINAMDFVVKVGAHDLQLSGTFMELEQVVAHENYDHHYHNDDIALLKLKQPLNFEQDTKISPVCLPPVGSSLGQKAGQMTTLVGWGVHGQNEYLPSNILYMVQVPIANRRQCRRAYTSLIGSNPIFNWNNVVCAAFAEGGKDSCQGDSGGPMTMYSDGLYYQVGIVSFGYGCAQKGYPGVYTYVPNYLNWIGAHMH